MKTIAHLASIAILSLVMCSCGALERFNEGYDYIKKSAESLSNRYGELKDDYNELKAVFKDNVTALSGNVATVMEYIKDKKAEIDTNKDNKVSWEEFHTYLLGGGVVGGGGAVGLLLRNAKSNRRKDEMEDKLNEMVEAFEHEKANNMIDERIKAAIPVVTPTVA